MHQGRDKTKSDNGNLSVDYNKRLFMYITRMIILSMITIGGVRYMYVYFKPDRKWYTTRAVFQLRFKDERFVE